MKKEYFIRVIGTDGDVYEHSVYKDPRKCLEVCRELQRKTMSVVMAGEREVEEAEGVEK